MADFSKMNYKELIQQSKELRAAEEARLAILRENNNVSAQELQEIIKKDAVLQNIKVKQADAVKYLKIQRDTQKVITDDLVRQEASLKSISAELAPIAALDRKRLDLQKAQSNISVEVAESYNSIAEKSQQLAALTKEDSVGRAILKDQIDEEIKDLESKGAIDKEILENLKEQRKLADNISSLSAEERDILTEQIRAYDSMKKTIRGTLDTIRMTLQTPQAMIVGASVAAGKFVGAMADVNKQTGMFMASTAGLSFVFDDAAGTLSQMAKLSGDVNKATFMAQLNTNVLATSMGIGGEEAATLVNAFGNLQGLSQETGEQMVSMVGNTARMSGVLPSQVMKDMAGASEEMALYSKGTGENFAMAAIQASKLGVSIATTAKMADNLLDFETSIEKELEASAMLGRDLNLSKARELAYAEDIEGATAEVLKQVGGIDEFNKMDVYQKKAVADALGVSVSELKQMSANQEELNNISKKYGENTALAYDYIRAMGEKFGGPIASGVTFFVGELIRAKLTAAAINGQGGLGGMLRSLNPFGRGGAPSAPTAPSTPPPTTSAPAANPGQQASSMTRFNPAQVLAGAAALLIVAAAVYVFAKAMQEFASVPVSAVLLGIVSLLALVGALALVGSIMMSGVGAVAIIAGAAAMLIIAAAMWVLGKALQEIAKVDPMALIQMGAAILAFGLMVAPLGLLFTPLMLAAVSMIALGGASLILGAGLIVLGAGLVLIGKGISAITSGLPLLVEQMGSLAQIDFLPILGLAGAFTALAFALGLVATMGLAALPVLAAVGLVAGGAAALMGGGGGAEKGGMLEEIKGLRNDLASGKIAVYMDGQLVTSKVANVASKNPVT